MNNKKNSKKNSVITLICYVIIALTILFIWSNSLQSPVETTEKSSAVSQTIKSIFKIFDVEINDDGFILKNLRKLAHFFEYFILSIELMFLPVKRKRKGQHFLNLLQMVVFVALIDETIQFFTGRMASVLDIWIDLSGFFMAFCIVKAISLIKKGF